MPTLHIKTTYFFHLFVRFEELYVSEGNEKIMLMVEKAGKEEGMRVNFVRIGLNHSKNLVFTDGHRSS